MYMTLIDQKHLDIKSIYWQEISNGIQDFLEIN